MHPPLPTRLLTDTKQENATAIVIEHRFYGESNPLPDLSSESLKLHTIQQAIDDLEYFAKNVKLPQPDGDAVAPGQAPWVLIGGSYAGALASFTMVKCVRFALRAVCGICADEEFFSIAASRTCSRPRTPRQASSRASCRSAPAPHT